MRKKKEEMQKAWREQAKEVDGVVDEEVVAEVVSKMTGVPLTRLEKKEAQRLLELENELHKRVVSQDDAIGAVAKSIRRARSGLKDPQRPIGTFLFLGPSAWARRCCRSHCRVHVRQRRGAGADRHVRVHGKAQRQPPDRRRRDMSAMRRAGS